MKKIITLSIALIFVSFLSFAQESGETASNESGAKIVFAETEYDFGDIYQGDVVQHIFEFTNEGDQPLIINNVLTTCGCTAPVWPRDPIGPGEAGKIQIKFNSTGKMGRQNKVITIRSNSLGDDHRIKIVSMVLPKQDN